jgi:LPXTG-site transpeptidase (sortase) family protein
MRSKLPLSSSLIIISAVGISCGAAIIVVAAPPPQKSIAVVATSGIEAPLMHSPGLPIRIIIPKININASLEHLGLTPSGAMAVTVGPTDAAWFDLGPPPGAIGTAVIAGHDGWKDNIPAVFDDLYELRAGDNVYVEDDHGSTTTFVVRSIQFYDQNADAATVFNSTDGKAHLNLITCEGIWNAAQKSYSNRLVVFTDEK